MLAHLGNVAIAEPFYIVADAYYAAHKIVAGLLQRDNHLVTRMKSNAVAYTPHHQCGPRKRGRPRCYGGSGEVNDRSSSHNRTTEVANAPQTTRFNAPSASCSTLAGPPVAELTTLGLVASSSK